MDLVLFHKLTIIMSSKSESSECDAEKQDVSQLRNPTLNTSKFLCV